ncbi:MAG TPA: hypothetical protein VIE43_11650 [Thermoanaerobaculia bacterium]|jgi:hypothetical protein|nr:hypothetical protein [Thermoanaerobaculia bacterium]
MKRDRLGLLRILLGILLGSLLGIAAALCAACAANPPAQPAETKPGEINLGGGTLSTSASEAAFGDGCPTGCVTPPPGCLIKGNINVQNGKKVYHVPGQRHYDDVTIETEAGERWFCTPDEAEANGWHAAKR